MSMNASRLERLFAACLLVAAIATACGGSEADDAFAEDDGAITRTTHLVTVDPTRQDSAVEVKASIKGWTLWLDPTVATRPADANGRRWTVKARVSKNVREVFAFVPDDAFGAARKTSARKFELDLNVHELATLVSGMPIFVRLVPESGATAFAAVSLQGRFQVPQGSTLIWLDRTIKPVAVNQELELRGSAALRSSARDLTVSGPGAPVLAAGASGKSSLDWSITTLTAAAEGTGLVFRAKDSRGRAISKRVGVELIVRTAGLTLADPYETWPSATCGATEKSCVAAAQRGGRTDLGACGDYRPVMACVRELQGAGGVDTSAERAAEVLKTELENYYQANAADIAADGVKSLEEAQAMVSAAGMNEITQPGGAPGFDLTTTRVWVHYEVVYESSDGEWIIGINKTTGAASATKYQN